MTLKDWELPDSIKCIVGEYFVDVDLEPRMKEVLRNDDKSEFVNLCNTLPCEDDAVYYMLYYIFVFDSVKCAAAIFSGETHDVNPDLNFKVYPSPVHEAVLRGARGLISLFLLHGEDANGRIPSGSYKDALPLDLALMIIRRKCLNQGLGHQNSLVKLFAFLCCPDMERHLEIAKLLAVQTKDLDQEVSIYLKCRRYCELGALLLLGFKPSTTYLLQWQEEGSEMEETMQLVNICEKIGDKLRIYYETRRFASFEHDTIIAEIASIFKNAGLETGLSVNRERQSIYGWGSTMSCEIKHGLFDKQAILGSNQMAKGLLEGSRSFCLSSTLKADKELAYSTQMENSAHVVPRLYFSKQYILFRAFIRIFRH